MPQRNIVHPWGSHSHYASKEHCPSLVTNPRQLDKLKGCDKVFKEKRSGVDAGRPELKRCLEYLREGDTLLVSKIDRLARSTSDLYRIVSLLAEKGVSFKVIDDPSIDTSSHRQAGDGHPGVDCRV